MDLVEVTHVPTNTDPNLTWIEAGVYTKIRDFDKDRTMIDLGGNITIIDNKYIIGERKRQSPKFI